MTVELEQAKLKRDASVLKIATPNPVCCDEGATIADLVNLMLESGMRRIPIVSEGELKGILSTWDVLDAFLRREDFSKPVSTIVIRDVIWCSADDTIGFVLQKLKLSRRGGFPVLRDKKIVGIVTERDYIKAFANVKFGTRVSEAMTPNPLFIAPGLSVMDCLKSLVNTRFRRLPVVKDSKLRGIVTTADLLHFIHANNYELEALKGSADQVIKKRVYTESPGKDLSQAIKKMIRYKVGGLVITEDDAVRGILTERDVLVEIV
jgi:CBS domain-containing protein